LLILTRNDVESEKLPAILGEAVYTEAKQVHSSAFGIVITDSVFEIWHCAVLLRGFSISEKPSVSGFIYEKY